MLDAAAQGLRLKRRRGSVTGEAARAHDVAEAERIVRAACKEFGLPANRNELAGRGRHRDGKALVAWLVRSMTSASNAWVAERLAMGHPTSVSRAARRVRNEGGLEKQGDKLQRAIMLKITD